MVPKMELDFIGSVGDFGDLKCFKSRSKNSKKNEAPLKTMFSTIGDPKSSKRRYQNNCKMEFFSGFEENIEIMLPPARGFTFRGSSHSKIIPFSDPFFMLAASRP